MSAPSAPLPDRGADEARLLRWADAGGTWRVVAGTPTRVTVALLTCDGGEEMERFDSAEPALIKRLSADGAGCLEGSAQPTTQEEA